MLYWQVMHKIMLIGGPSRVGKSTLAESLRPKINGQIVAGDAFSRGIRESVGAERFPDLFVDLVDKHGVIDSHEQTIGHLRRRDKAMWIFYKNYIEAVAHDSHDDLLIDGNFWPDYLTKLDIDHRAIFLVDTSPDRANFLKQVRDDETTANNWMRQREWSDEKIDKWAEMDIKRSLKIIELCKQYNYPCFDVATHGFTKAQELASAYLLA